MRKGHPWYPYDTLKSDVTRGSVSGGICIGKMKFQLPFWQLRYTSSHIYVCSSSSWGRRIYPLRNYHPGPLSFVLCPMSQVSHVNLTKAISLFLYRISLSCWCLSSCLSGMFYIYRQSDTFTHAHTFKVREWKNNLHSLSVAGEETLCHSSPKFHLMSWVVSLIPSLHVLFFLCSLSYPKVGKKPM